MQFGFFSGLLWGLDTVILGIGLALAPYIGSAEALACASIAGSFLHDAFCAIWLFGYMGVRGRLKDTLAALKTRSGKVVIAGALLGGPIGMTGYVLAINNIGAAYTAIISAFYPAVGAFLSFVLLKEKMGKGQILSLLVALCGVMTMGYLSAGSSEIANAPLGLLGAVLAVIGWGSEAVLCAWGMKDDAVDDETALQIRETTSARTPPLRSMAFHVGRYPKHAHIDYCTRRTRRNCILSVLLQGHCGNRSSACDDSEYLLFGMVSGLWPDLAWNNSRHGIRNLLRCNCMRNSFGSQ